MSRMPRATTVSRATTIAGGTWRDTMTDRVGRSGTRRGADGASSNFDGRTATDNGALSGQGEADLPYQAGTPHMDKLWADFSGLGAARYLSEPTAVRTHGPVLLGRRQPESLNR